MIWHKVYRKGDVVLAMADEELMGKDFEEGKFLLSVGEFYKGELVEEGNAAELLDDATIINAVGERSVQLVIDAGMATPRSVKRVSGIPHVQAFLHVL